MPQGHATETFVSKKAFAFKASPLEAESVFQKVCNRVLESQTFGARWVGGNQLAQAEDGYNLGSQEAMESSACDGLLGGRPGDF